MDKLKPPSVPADSYTRDYFERWCQGYEEFQNTGGQELPARLQIPLELIQIKAGARILDIGCGRGELARHCAQQEALVWALDYAWAAVELAYESLAQTAPSTRQRIKLLQADARLLPLERESVDAVFMLDVVEHLLPEELDRVLQEIRRVLKPEGKLIIHTMPNIWYYRAGYPIFRLLQRLRGQRLPPDPRDRWPFKEVHVNEQTPWSLYRTLRQNGFRARVWLQSAQQYRYEPNRLVRWGMQFLVAAPLVKFIFCNDIFAAATKK